VTDGLELYALRYQQEGMRFSSRHTLSFLRYGISNASSNTFLLSGLNTAIYRAGAAQLTSDTAKLRFLNSTYERYTSGTRFGAARSLETRWESTGHWTINRFFTLSGGGQLTFSNGKPYNPYYRIPVPVSAVVNRDLPPNAAPFDPVVFNDQDVFVFSQLDIHTGRIRAIVGASTQSSLRRFDPVLVPNAAILYEIDSTWALRGSFSAGFRRPGWFAAANSFYIANGRATPSGDLTAFQTERFSAYEAGIRRYSKQLRIDVAGFWQRADFLNRNGHFSTVTTNQSYYGFENGPRGSKEQWGVQTWIVAEQPQLLEMTGLGRGDIRINWRGELYLQYANGRERWRTDEALDGIRMFPGWIAQLRSSWRGGKVQFMMATNRQSSFPDRAPLWAADWNPENVNQRIRRFRTWDFSLHYYLSKNFVLYCQVMNAFNRRPVGLDATDTIDDLLYNPQLGRLWRLGVHYSVN
jgi:TonB dependent receptor